MYDIPKFEQCSEDQQGEDDDTTTFPPHVFTIASRAYRRMVDKRKDQSVIVSGESGAGKTEACKKIMTYLAHLSQQVDVGAGQEENMMDIEEKVWESLLPCAHFIVLAAMTNVNICGICHAGFEVQPVP